jgi:hypothetical protein
LHSCESLEHWHIHEWHAFGGFWVAYCANADANAHFDDLMRKNNAIMMEKWKNWKWRKRQKHGNTKWSWAISLISQTFYLT